MKTKNDLARLRGFDSYDACPRPLQEAIDAAHTAMTQLYNGGTPPPVRTPRGADLPEGYEEAAEWALSRPSGYWTWSHFMTDMVEILAQGRTLSPRRAEGLVRSVESAKVREATREAQRAAEAEALAMLPPLGAGRLTFTGRFLRGRLKETPYGGQWKAVFVTVDGYRIWTSIPMAVLDAAERASGAGRSTEEGLGRAVSRVHCRLTVTVSPKEHAFGFGSRPTAADVVVQGADEVGVPYATAV